MSNEITITVALPVDINELDEATFSRILDVLGDGLIRTVNKTPKGWGARKVLKNAAFIFGAKDDTATDFLRNTAIRFNQIDPTDWNGGDVVEYLTEEMQRRNIDIDEGAEYED